MDPAFYQKSDLLRDYQNQKESLKPFYSQSLFPDWEKLAEQVSAGFKQQNIIDELILQNQSTDNVYTDKNCRLLKEKNTVIVITGQQMGLMVSPLYIIYKTLTTIWLANKLNNEIEGYNFIPVFWLEGEDHDYDEVKSVHFPGLQGDIQTLSVPENTSDLGMSMNKRQLSGEINNVLTELKKALQQTDFSDNLFSKIKQIYQPGKNWLDAFKEHIADIFKDSGLLFFNAGTERIKKLSIPFFKEILLQNSEIVSCFVSQSKVLEKAGFINQVNIQDNKAYLFFTKNGTRQSLYLKNDIYHIKETDESYTTDEMIDFLEQNPQWFSSTVLTRPIWQSYLLPVVSYVAGGAEIAYWSQLKSAFEKMHIIMPHIQPRHSVTLVEPKTERHLNKYNLDINTISQDKSQFIKEYFASTSLSAVTDALSEFEKNAEQYRKKVSGLIKEIDPTLISPAEKSFDSINDTISKLNNRLSGRISEREGTIKNHLNSIHESILPDGVLQERLITSIYFQNKYGREWIKRIMDEMVSEKNFSGHLIVRL